MSQEPFAFFVQGHSGFAYMHKRLLHGYDRLIKLALFFKLLQLVYCKAAVQLKRHDDGHRRQLCAADIHQDRQLTVSPGKLPVINKRRFGGRTFHCRKPNFVLAGAERACAAVV